MTEKELQQKIKEVITSGRRTYINVDDCLALDVLTSGKKIWRFRYYVPGYNSQKTMKLGEYPLVSLKQARSERDYAKSQLFNGTDPARKLSEAPTLEVLFEEFLKKKIIPKYKKKCVDNYRSRMRTLLRGLGSRKVDDIESSEFLAEIEKEEEKNNNDKALRMRQISSAMYRYAISKGYCKYDPTYALRGALCSKGRVKHLARITDPEKVGQLMRDIRDKGKSPIMRALLTLHAYTFLRPLNIREAEWSEFDYISKDPMWHIPGKKMKMGFEHFVPLARQVVELLKNLHIQTGHGRYLFPAATAWDGSRHISDNAENKALREKGYDNETMVGHGFRGMGSTLLHENNWETLIVEAQLAHCDNNESRASYNDATYMRRRRVMMQWYADYLDSLRDGTEPPEIPR